MRPELRLDTLLPPVDDRLEEAPLLRLGELVRAGAERVVGAGAERGALLVVLLLGALERLGAALAA